MTGGSQFRPALNLASTAQVLEKAFSFKDAPAVAISINSPGGSPVQSRLIFTRIRELAREKQKKVIVFVEDVAASGGYMIALRATRSSPTRPRSSARSASSPAASASPSS
jgi:serine protease SohB